MARDIGECELTEAREKPEGRESDAAEYARSLIEVSLDPLVTISPEGKITDVNEATIRVTGRARDELIGTDFSDYFTDPESARRGYREAFDKGSVTDYPLTIRHQNGRLTDVLYNASVYRGREGDVLGVFAAARDISHRRQAEAIARAERQRLNDVLEMMPVYTILLSRDYHVVFANRFFEERFGKSDGRRCFEYLFGRTEPCEICRTYEVFETQAPLNWEWTGPDHRDYDILDFPFTDSDGSDLIMEVGIDVTDRKRAEDELREHQKTLESRVAERTEELAQANALLRAEVEERTKAEREKDRLYEAQRRIAEHLQQAMLDIPAHVERLSIGHLYRSATEAARVGGDFYDVFEARKGRIALLIGDVAGHGIEAARSATLVKDVVHAFIHQTLQPQKVLRSTNRLLIEKSPAGFVTLFLGILDTNTGKLRYCSAGHPEALLRRTSGEVQTLGSGSLPLGIFPEATWTASDGPARDGRPATALHRRCHRGP